MAKSKLLGGATNIIIGAAVASFAEPFIDTALNRFGITGMIDDAAKLGIGYFLAKRGGIAKGVGIALLVLGTSRLVGRVATGGLTSTNTGGW